MFLFLLSHSSPLTFSHLSFFITQKQTERETHADTRSHILTYLSQFLPLSFSLSLSFFISSYVSPFLSLSNVHTHTLSLSFLLSVRDGEFEGVNLEEDPSSYGTMVKKFLHT